MKKKIQQKSSASQKKVSVRPLGDRVLVRPLSPEEIGGKTIGGLIIPDTLAKDKPEQGVVLAVGDGRFDDGVRVPMSVNVGDTVMFSKYGYDEVKVEGEELYIIKEDNILAIIS